MKTSTPPRDFVDYALEQGTSGSEGVLDVDDSRTN